MVSAICNFIMADLKEQCICIKFCMKLGKNASETQEMTPWFIVTTQDLTAVLSLKKPVTSTSEESKVSQVTHEEKVDFL